MGENANVTATSTVKKKRRTAEQIAADKLAREKQLQEEAAAAKANIVSWEKEIAEAEAKIKAAKNKLKSSRNTIRDHHGMVIYADLVNALGFGDTEKDCYTKEDFEALRSLVINRVKSLLNIEKKNVKTTDAAPAENVPAEVVTEDNTK